MQLQFESIAQQLLDQDIAILDGWLPIEVLDALRIQATEQFKSGEFETASIGKGIEKQRITEIRSDRVLWLDREGATAELKRYWSFVDGLRSYLSEFFRVHLERTELHFAVYPEGGFYAPHLDQFRGHGNRIFSIILYLNPHWQSNHGGELRIHNENTYHDIEPLHGRLVCFRSDTVLHEVLVANMSRVSLTGWMRKDPLIF